MKCTNCGAEVADSAKFCPECGQKIERKKFCPGCGAEVSGGKFCPECGAPLTGETPQKVVNEEVLDEDNQIDELLKGFDNLVAAKTAQEEKAAEYNKNIKTARTYVKMEKYAEAKKLYDGLLNDNPDDMEIYMGYIRIATKNYTEYEGGEIEKSIRIAQRKSRKDDLSQFDSDYAAFESARKQYFTEKAEKERREQERKEQERKEAERKEAERREQERLAKELERIAEEKRKAILNIGDYKNLGNGYITFGAYPQSKKGDNITIGEVYDKEHGYYLGSDNSLYEKYNNEYYKVEPIKWKVLSLGSEFFVVSDMILDHHRFDKSYNNYANSEIRSWLNGEFYNKAFRDGQKSKIATTNVDNSLASTCDSKNEYVCGNTSDKVFLLSRKEAEQYFSSNEARKRVPTEYAIARGAYQYTDNDNRFMRNGKVCGWWWLRSPSCYNSYGAQGVLDDGHFDWSLVNYYKYGAFPALKIKP